MRTGLIYIVTNSNNNKVYIGKTIQTLNSRWTKHKSDARNENDGNTEIFHKAIRKYGEDTFSISVLEDNIPIKDIPEKERYYIAKYNSQAPNGYNILPGGEDSCGEVNKKPVYQLDLVTSQVIEKFDSVIEASIITDINRTSIGDTARGKRKSAGKFRWCFEEDLEKIQNNPYSEEEIKSILNGYIKQVYQIDMMSNKIIKKWESETEASNALNISKAALSNALNGKTKTCGKFRWAFGDNLENILSNPLTEDEISATNKKGAKKVQQINLKTGEVIAEYDSCTLAGKALGISNNGICRVARGERKSCSGYGWKYI